MAATSSWPSSSSGLIRMTEERHTRSADRSRIRLAAIPLLRSAERQFLRRYYLQQHDRDPSVDRQRTRPSPCGEQRLPAVRCRSAISPAARSPIRSTSRPIGPTRSITRTRSTTSSATVRKPHMGDHLLDRRRSELERGQCRNLRRFSASRRCPGRIGLCRIRGHVEQSADRQVRLVQHQCRIA